MELLQNKYVRLNPSLQRLCPSVASRSKHRRWLLRAVAVIDCEKQLAVGVARGISRGDGKKRYVRDALRRKAPGQYGMHRIKAFIVREHLFEWFSVLRHSVDFRVMTRFPPKLVELKAKQLVQDYIAACLKEGVQPDPPIISGHWLKDWQLEYRVSFRRPSRKFKVPKRVLEERLRIFWANMLRVRTMAQRVLGYDLDVTNMDQSPFHMNEAGAICFFVLGAACFWQINQFN